MAPKADWTWLWNIVHRLNRIAVPGGRKHGRLVPSNELFSFGLELMHEADRNTIMKPLRKASMFRDGLMISLLAARPFRIRNFTSIEIGQHLSEKGERYYLHFEAAETKTSKALEMPFPPNLVIYLVKCLTLFRPILLTGYVRTSEVSARRATTLGLWISVFGRKMAEVSIYCRIVKQTKKKFGKSVNPHLFRDCVATSIALEDPQHVHIITSILGHTTLSTSERYYNHASSLKASGMYQAQILSMRRDTAKIARNQRQRGGKINHMNGAPSE
jgi:integrase/recombinase XerD